MKKIILGLFVGIFMTSGIVFAYQYNANDIVYTPSNPNWKVNSVKSAIDDLKTKHENSYGKLTTIWSSYSPTVSYTYNVSLNGKYLAGMLTCNHTNTAPSIVSTSDNILIDRSLTAGGGCAANIKLIDANNGDRISFDGYNGYSRSNDYSSAFLVKLEGIDITTIISSGIKDDGTRTDSYTATKNNEKVLLVAMNNGTSRSLSINPPSGNLEARITNTTSVISYNILSNASTISADVYGYNYGAGVVLLLK